MSKIEELRRKKKELDEQIRLIEQEQIVIVGNVKLDREKRSVFVSFKSQNREILHEASKDAPSLKPGWVCYDDLGTQVDALIKNLQEIRNRL